MKNTLVFVHGLESTAQGTKGQFFHQNFPQMIIENFTGNFPTRMKKLVNILTGMTSLIIVGSSYGGLMAANYAMENISNVKKMILLAPALHLPEFHPDPNQKLHIPVIIYHGIDDAIVDPYIVKDIAFKSFINLEHNLMDDDHSLHKTFGVLNWQRLLKLD
jgi:predicted alpha/beta-hydrolase family hydrolase